MRWFVYDDRGNHIGTIRAKNLTRRAVLAKAKKKFGYYVETMLTDGEKITLERKLKCRQE